MIREIGSEFHKEVAQKGNGLVFPLQGVFTFSGRTALEIVLKKIPEAKKALLPSYCCDSMIEPFIKTGIELDYYPVYYENGLKVDLKIPEDIDVLVWCNYFGFRLTMPDISEFVKKGGIIIEDITHSFFSPHPYHQQSHYYVASLRKWEPIVCGGFCASVNGDLLDTQLKPPPKEFVDLKITAMKMKADYLLKPDAAKKAQFLSMFDKSNRWIRNNYSGLSIDSGSMKYLDCVDMIKQKKTRVRNARILYKGLKKVQFLFPEKDMVCPLFVPIVLPNRDEVRSVLINNNIYCPIHWPKPKNCESNLYDHELSIICDQRYNEDDMERIISVLQEIL